MLCQIRCRFYAYGYNETTQIAQLSRFRPNSWAFELTILIYSMRHTINDLTAAQDINNGLDYIQAVINQGYISETRGIKHYCHHTVFTTSHGTLVGVSCVLTRAGNISFTLRDVTLT